LKSINKVQHKMMSTYGNRSTLRFVWDKNSTVELILNLTKYLFK